MSKNSPKLGVSNRDLGTIEQIYRDGQLTVRLDNERRISFDPRQMRHFDHGYAVTSHSSQGLTAERVLVNIDSNVHPELIKVQLARTLAVLWSERNRKTAANPLGGGSVASSITRTSNLDWSARRTKASSARA